MKHSKDLPCPCGSRSTYKYCCWMKDQFKEVSIQIAPNLESLLSLKIRAKFELEKLGISDFKEVSDWVIRERVTEASAKLNSEGCLVIVFRVSYMVSSYHVLIREDHPSGTLSGFCNCPKSNADFRCVHLDTSFLYLWLSLNYDNRAKALHFPIYLKKQFNPFCDQIVPILQIRNLIPDSLSEVATPSSPAQSPKEEINPTRLNLDSLFFCPPGFFPILENSKESNNQASSTPLLTVPLPPASTPVKKERNETSSLFAAHHSSSLSKNASANPLLTPENRFASLGFTPSQSRRLRELQHSLQYQFNDGTVLTSYEVENYPRYRKAVPDDLLPSYHLYGGSEILYRESDYCLYSLGLLRSASNRDSRERQIDGAEITLIRLLASYFRKTSPKKPKLWIVDSQNREVTRGALLIRSGKFHRDSPGHWKLLPDSNPLPDQPFGSALLSYIPLPFDSESFLYRGFELNIKKQTLTFHRLSAALEIANNALLPRINNGTMTTTFHLSSPKVIQSSLSYLNQILQFNQLSPVDRPPPEIVSSAKIKNQIRVQSSGGFQICRKVQIGGEEICLWNIPTSATPLLRGLESGLASFFNKEAISLASRSHWDTRSHDLKFLKHSGLFSLMLLETLSYLLFQKSSDGTVFSKQNQKKDSHSQKKAKGHHRDKEFLNNLLEKIGRAYATLKQSKRLSMNGADRVVQAQNSDSDLDSISLNNFCSPKVIRLIESFVEEVRAILKSQNETFFTRTGEIEIVQAGRFPLELLYHLLTFIAEHHGVNPFLKSQTPLLSRTSPSASASASASAASLVSLEQPLSYSSDLTSSHSQWVSEYQFPQSSGLSSIQILHAFTPMMGIETELTYDSRDLLPMGDSDFKSGFHLTELETVSEFPMSSSQQLDWFELHPQVFFKGREIHPEELNNINNTGWIEHQGKIYLIPKSNLPKIRHLTQFWQNIQRHPQRKNRKSFEAILFSRIKKSQTLELLALRATGIQVTGGKRWQEICRFYDSLDNRKGKLQIPKSTRATLKEYQVTGVQWLLDLYELGLGGILADDMGLGKTLQTLTFLDIVKSRKPHLKKVLIVVPTSLTYNWLQESEKFTPELNLKVFQSETKHEILEEPSSNSRSPQIFLCTYGLFLDHKELFQKTHWDISIFDEAQNLKNITSQRTAAARELPSTFKLCLTGTPLENHLGEFYCLMDLVVSGCLGDYDHFRRTFISPEQLNEEKVHFLKLKAKPLVLRRTKKEILVDLPPKTETLVKLPFEKKQEKIYRDIAIACNEKVKGVLKGSSVESAQIVMLSALLRLRQTCSDPASVPNVKYAWVPPKIKELAHTLEEITANGDSALVFTQFLSTFHRIQENLAKLKIKNFGIHGGISRTQREKILREFQESNTGSVLLMTLKTGGVGLNLTKASYIFHIEPWWNPAVENQATDRAYRIGQEQEVKVFRYLMRDSVEEKIQILKNRKQKRFDSLFSDEEDTELESSFSKIGRTSTGAGSNLLTQADFEYLLS